MVIYVKNYFISILSPFSGFITRFYRCVDFTHIEAQTEQVMTSRIRSHRIFNTYLLYSCAHFVVEIDEKYGLNGGF